MSDYRKCIEKNQNPSENLAQRYNVVLNDLCGLWQILPLSLPYAPYAPRNDDGWRPYADAYDIFAYTWVDVFEESIYLDLASDSQNMLQTIADTSLRRSIENARKTGQGPLKTKPVTLCEYERRLRSFVRDLQRRGEPIIRELQEERGTSEPIDTREVIGSLTDWIHIAIPLHGRRKELKRLVNEVIDAYQNALEKIGCYAKGRARFENYEIYLRIYDLKEAGKTWKRIVQEVFGDELSDEDRENKYALRAKLQSLKEKAIDNYNRAKELIEGGWREIR